jgi:hypothetical protein
MIAPPVGRIWRVIAVAEIADAVGEFQRGESNVDKTLERIAWIVTRVAEAERQWPAA